MELKPNCLKVVYERNNKFESIHGEENLGRFNRVYDIGKPTISEDGTLLFCYDLSGKRIKQIFSAKRDIKSRVYLAHATETQKFVHNLFIFSFIPKENYIENYWIDNRRLIANYAFDSCDDWILAKSITLLEQID